MDPYELYLILKTHLLPTTLKETFGKTKSQVLFIWRAWNSSYIVLNHIGSESDCEADVRSVGQVRLTDKILAYKCLLWTWWSWDDQLVEVEARYRGVSYVEKNDERRSKWIVKEMMKLCQNKQKNYVRRRQKHQG